MKGLVPILGMMNASLFFVFSSIIGYEYSGVENSNLYIFYVVIVAFLNLYLFSKHLLFKNSKLKYNELLVISFPFVVFTLFLTRGLINNGFNPLAVTYFSYFLIWTVPSIYIAIFVNREKVYEDLAKWFEVIMILMSISIVNTTILPFIQGIRFTTLGGATYQTASYLSAFAFGLNLYFILHGESHIRFSFTKSKFYKMISYLLLFIQVVGVFLSGGRGGIILVFMYVLCMLYFSFKSKKIKKIFKTSIFMSGSAIFLAILFPILLQNEIFYQGQRRVLEFLSFGSGINWAGTSNRDILYLNTIDLIKNNLFFGYGLYGFWDVSGYPHNIILEVLLNGGVVFLIIFILCAIAFTHKLYRMTKYNNSYNLLIVLILYPLTMLMFSGTYMINTEFWFVVALVLSFSEMSTLKKAYYKNHRKHNGGV